MSGGIVRRDPSRGPIAEDAEERVKDSVSRLSVGDAQRTVGSPLGKFIKREIDQKEYVRQLNEKRERHGLPPVRPQTAAGQ